MYTCSPCCGVPLPRGNPRPSGKMLISHAAISSGDAGWPRLGPPAMPAEPSTIIRGAARTIGLNVNMLHLAGWHDRPTRNGVEMIYRPAAALGDLLRTCRLDVAFVVDGAALQRRAAGVQLAPPSADTSTRATLPLPDHAKPATSYSPGPFKLSPGEGWVMIDFASMGKKSWSDSPLSISRVYLDVSSLVITGMSVIFRRRSHLTCMLPSYPGSSRRIG